MNFWVVLESGSKNMFPSHYREDNRPFLCDHRREQTHKTECNLLGFRHVSGMVATANKRATGNFFEAKFFG
jgi:hypothetical protein